MALPIRPANRSPFPPPDLLLRDLNHLLSLHGLPQCSGFDGDGILADTANPIAVGIVDGRRYVIKVITRDHSDPVSQMRAANLIRERTGLPIPTHLCACADRDRLPLLVMEWMPGQPMAQMFSRLDRAGAKTIVGMWGEMSSRFHHAKIPELQEISMDRAGYFCRELPNVVDRFRCCDRINPSTVDAVKTHLNQRTASLQTWALPGLDKADEDITDFLVLESPSPHISAMLDFERVGPGDTIYNLAVVYLRLNLIGLGDLWDDYLAGYQRASGVVVQQGPQMEFYLMWRAAIAAVWSKRAAEIIDELLAHRPIISAMNAS